MYRYADTVGYKSFRVNDLKESSTDLGPFVEFAVPIIDFEKALRTLNSANNRMLVAELNMGLDHITLRDDLTPLAVVQSFV